MWRAHGQSYRRDVPVTRASRMPQMRIAIDETLIRVRSQLTKLKSRGVHLSQPRATRHTWSRAIGHTSTRPSACKTGLSSVARAHTNKTDRARSIQVRSLTNILNFAEISDFLGERGVKYLNRHRTPKFSSGARARQPSLHTCLGRIKHRGEARCGAPSGRMFSRVYATLCLLECV